MASEETWQKLKFFKKEGSDVWGDAELIADDLLFRLDDFRRNVGVAVNVLRGVATAGHSTNSFHYPQNGSCAVDVVLPQYKGRGLELVLEANRFGFTGIGWYPHWRFKGETVGGLHLDTRPLRRDSDGTLNYRYNRWIGVLKDGKQVYEAMSAKRIIELGG